MITHKTALLVKREEASGKYVVNRLHYGIEPEEVLPTLNEWYNDPVYVSDLLGMFNGELNTLSGSHISPEHNYEEFPREYNTNMHIDSFYQVILGSNMDVEYVYYFDDHEKEWISCVSY